MGWRIEISEANFDRLHDHLGGEVEQVAFLFSEPYRGDEVLRVADLRLLSPADFDFQSDYHVELGEQLRPELIKQAWDTDACLIEAHSHVLSPAEFSTSDFFGFTEWVPHLRWRLRNRPYAALVFAPEDFDGLVWGREGEPVGLEAIKIEGQEFLAPTGHSARQLRRRSERSQKRWGPDGR